MSFSDSTPPRSPEFQPNQPERERIDLPRSVRDIEGADFESIVRGGTIDRVAAQPESIEQLTRMQRVRVAARNIGAVIRSRILDGASLSWGGDDTVSSSEKPQSVMDTSSTYSKDLTSENDNLSLKAEKTKNETGVRSASELWSTLNEQAGDSNRQHVIGQYQEKLSTSEMQSIAEKEAEIKKITNAINSRYHEEQDWRKDKADSDRIKEIEMTVDDLHGKGALAAYRQLNWLKTQTEESGQLYLDEIDSYQMAARLLGEASNRKDTNQARLFNTGDEERVRRLRTRNISQIHLNFDRNKPPLDIPIGMFASASGMESWRDGRGEGKMAGSKLSVEKIEDYASQPAETAPPVSQVAAFVLPDGRVYIHSENAHRVAAAIRRGDPYVKFSGSMNLYILDEAPDVFRSDSRENDIS